MPAERRDTTSHRARRDRRGAPRSETHSLTLSRRQVLGGCSALALITLLSGCDNTPEVAALAPDADQGQPWDDGTYWDDGTGWL